LRKAKPFNISKGEVWEAYKRVKANRGAAGVDHQSLDAFDSLSLVFANVTSLENQFYLT